MVWGAAATGYCYQMGETLEGRLTDAIGVSERPPYRSLVRATGYSAPLNGSRAASTRSRPKMNSSAGS